MNPNEIKFRASSMHHLMTDPRSAAAKSRGELSESAKTHVLDVYISKVLNRKQDVESKYMEKGNERENDAITMVALNMGIFLKKNDIRLENDWVAGECDIYEGETITTAKITHDTKCSWSCRTFFQNAFKPICDEYYFQGQTYMWLTGAERHYVHYCLINSTDKIIMDERRKLSWKLNIMPGNEDESPEYIQKAKQIERNHIFDMEAFKNEFPGFHIYHGKNEWQFDIPENQRIITIGFDRDETVIDRMKKRVEQAWQHIEHIHQTIKNLGHANRI